MSNKMRALLGGVVLAVAISLMPAAVSHAATNSSLNCRTGGAGTRSGWATCTGWGTWRVTAQCYYWGANSSSYSWQAGGTQTKWATCPRWSYVTWVYIEQR